MYVVLLQLRHRQGKQLEGGYQEACKTVPNSSPCKAGVQGDLHAQAHVP